jgi:hypothetical protein
MEERKEHDELLNESLADVPPTPVSAEGAVPLAGGPVPLVLMLAAGGAFAYMVIASSMTPTMGATRSAQLEWERRNQQIEQAMREAEIDSPQEAPDGNPRDCSND